MTTLLPSARVETLDDLAAVLSPGEGLPFTRHLLGALETGTREDRANLGHAYPRHLLAWQWWSWARPGRWTAGELRAALASAITVSHGV